MVTQITFYIQFLPQPLTMRTPRASPQRLSHKVRCDQELEWLYQQKSTPLPSPHPLGCANMWTELLTQKCQDPRHQLHSEVAGSSQ